MSRGARHKGCCWNYEQLKAVGETRLLPLQSAKKDMAAESTNKVFIIAIKLNIGALG